MTVTAAVLVWVRRRRGAEESELHAQVASRYVEVLGESKGVLMKAGQMLSLVLMAPVVPFEFRAIYEEALACLRTDAPPMRAELVREVLERELGRPVEEVFAEFEEEPLAAASVGQVHAARLFDGRSVAVKVQYPGAAEAIAADLQNTELLATFLTLVFSCLFRRGLSFDVRGAAREIGIRIGEELDFENEAANQAEFAAYYRGHPYIHVPEVVDELCTPRVLTQELVEGWSWQDALTASQELRNRWGEAIWRFVYGSNVRFGALHADPHPGNYLFHEDGSVSVMDFGCVKHFDDEHSGMMGGIGPPCVKGDVRGTWHASVEYGFWPSSAPVTPEEAFALWRERLEIYWAEQPFAVTPEFVATWMRRRFTTDGPRGNAIRHATASPEYTILERIEIGAISMIGQLHASNDWKAIAAEYFEGAAPVTEMGAHDHVFFAGAGR